MVGRFLSPFVTLFVLAALLAGCGDTLRARFDAFGNIDAARGSGPMVSSESDVEVFYGTAPAGFSLRDNELTIEPGHNHRILGSVEILRGAGPCAAQNVRKPLVLEAMRKAAHDNGGNAVVYATSRVSDEPTDAELCDVPEGGIGAGWVVVIAAPDDPEPTL